jgi:hypothetical protein
LALAQVFRHDTLNAWEFHASPMKSARAGMLQS